MGSINNNLIFWSGLINLLFLLSLQFKWFSQCDKVPTWIKKNATDFFSSFLFKSRLYFFEKKFFIFQYLVT